MAGRRFILAGRFIDGSGSRAARNVFLGVTGSIITEIGSVSDLTADLSAKVDDFSHCTIVPALVDCSVSLGRSPSVDCGTPSATDEDQGANIMAMVERHILYCHIHGVQGVAEGDDTKGLVREYQTQMGQNIIIDIRNSGGRLGGIEGCADGPFTGDFIKIGYCPDIEDEDDVHPRFDREELSRILRQRGEKKAVVVANGPGRVAEALAAGCDAIEQGYGMGEDNLRDMAEKGVLWIPGLLRAKNGLDGSMSGGEVCCRFSQRYVAPGKAKPGAEARWKKRLAEQLAQLGLARKLGVKTAVGTGAGSAGLLHGESMVEEMKLFIRAGYSLEETIRCASENGALFFGMERLGRLAVGRKATFLITRGSVTQLPRKLSYLEGIYVDGAPSPIYRKNPVKKG